MSNIIILSLLSLGLVTSFSFIFSVKQQFQFVEYSDLIGNEKLTTKSIDVGNFHAVEVNDQIKVILIQGENAVEISAEENLIDLLIVENNDGTLVIYKHMNNNQYVEQKLPMVVTISAPNFTEITARHQSEVTVKGKLAQNALKVDLSDQGNINAELEIERLDLRAKQQSNVTLFGSCEYLNLVIRDQVGFMSNNMEVDNANVSISNNADVRMHVTGEVSGKVDHNATLDLKGNPNTAALEKSSLARVK